MVQIDLKELDITLCPSEAARASQTVSTLYRECEVLEYKLCGKSNTIINIRNCIMLCTVILGSKIA